MSPPRIRPETMVDIDGIGYVVERSLGKQEAHLVAELRRHNHVTLSLVAVVHEQVTGHILFSPVVIETPDGQTEAVGLAPLSVVPAYQRQGIGTALVRTGVELLRQSGHGAVMVLGHPGYYARFGFRPAATYGIKCQYDVPDEAFMALELTPGALMGKAGTAVYAPEFNAL